MNTPPAALPLRGIALLRSLEETPVTQVPWLQVSVAMRSRLPRQEVEARTNLSTSDLLDAVVELGTWLGLRHKAAANVPLPPGFSRTACGRDLRRAVSNCATHVLTEEDLSSFRPEVKRRVVPKVTAELAQTLCTIARLRGLDGIEELTRLPDGKLDPVLARSIVLTYDVLSDAITAAGRAVGVLQDLVATTPLSQADVRDVLETVHWVDPAYVERLMVLLDGADINAVSARLSHPAGLSARIPKCLGDLRYGQVLQLLPDAASSEMGSGGQGRLYA